MNYTNLDNLKERLRYLLGIMNCKGSIINSNPSDALFDIMKFLTKYNPESIRSFYDDVDGYRQEVYILTEYGFTLMACCKFDTVNREEYQPRVIFGIRDCPLVKIDFKKPSASKYLMKAIQEIRPFKNILPSGKASSKKYDIVDKALDNFITYLAKLWQNALERYFSDYFLSKSLTITFKEDIINDL